jgi:hypothetical protein
MVELGKSPSEKPQNEHSPKYAEAGKSVRAAMKDL